MTFEMASFRVNRRQSQSIWRFSYQVWYQTVASNLPTSLHELKAL